MQSVADFLRRFPWIAHFVTTIWRLGRPKYSAGVIGVVLNDQHEVLVVEHVFHAKVPWGLPGDWVDRAEELETSLKREFSEELQLEINVETVLLTEIARQHGNHIDIAYLCRANNPVGKLSSELLSYQWATFENLPQLPAFHYRAIQRALEIRS